ncbi:MULTISPECIES: hypothetical protein [Prochlorococcus]|uniref:Uncharacterized protein n=1 Tax=Prochlorococcus marinus (strain SARG / CCMP1375 / SS120) TaxID=167539 RepID=Q7VAU8_PROMA|nr:MULTISPECIES: hypothetical protein [Prochlorococcus]AAQ00400.1 Uncharacterized protein Pro_1356 [Prochlorococcus marinus subsp. marinus str. CCMP1375]KGG14281.1 hypothetical protein EV04_0133 [Prochlorococcus marinus str. LG]KGG22146.1 hypothetical protein EV08_0321 [Prochlorococcus marinus str. SS2]KGG24536.1 hypothetical protein EV09_0167 [Prochlorococcus marinus str. SS35]KGG33431.1 hypothetical protein EV10_0639 [Prochlorococcus marinus str. SS51]
MDKQTPSFEEAMNAASLWCNAWEEGELSDEVLADRVAELVETINGARGFFVISLSSNSPLMDRLPEALIFRLRAAGDSVIDLTIRNLAMSTAMSLHHERDKNLEQKYNSEQIKRRCIELLRLLEPNSVKEKIEQLIQSISGEGCYGDFLKRWGYDEEQKKAIISSINSIVEN